MTTPMYAPVTAAPMRAAQLLATSSRFMPEGFSATMSTPTSIPPSPLHCNPARADVVRSNSDPYLGHRRAIFERLDCMCVALLLSLTPVMGAN